MTKSFLRRLLHVGILAAGCTACAGGSTAPAGAGWRPAVFAGAQGAVAEPAPLRAFIAGAAPGEHAEIAADGAGPRLQVTLEREYHAASGRTCRQLRLGEDGAPPTVRHACRDERGLWRLLPALRNRGRDGAQAL